MKSFKEYLVERTLTPAELKKREEVAKAIERENPGISMDKKMAIATATAKKAGGLGEEVVDENAFDWKSKKSEVSWNGEPEKKSSAGGTIHTAKKPVEAPKEKKGIGRPAGTYGSYKIDKATRDDPEYKKKLSAKVMAAKADGFAARKEFKDSMNAAIKKRQEELYNASK